MTRNDLSIHRLLLGGFILAMGFGPALQLDAQSNRVTRDLLVLYEFSEADGDVVHDSAEVDGPLDLTIGDIKKVKWSRGFLTLKNETWLKSAGPATRLNQAIAASQSVTIEAWVKPASNSQKGPARIVSLSVDASNRNLTLGQQADAWEVRMRTSETGANGVPGVVSKAETCNTSLSHVAYTRSADGQARIYVDGNVIASETVAGDLSNWEASYPLILANEGSTDRAWLGELHLVAIYGTALTDVEIGQNFQAGLAKMRALAAQLPPPADRQIDFVAEVQPILRKHCFECHAAGNEEGNLNLAIRARVMEGGAHGAALQRGDSLNSALIHWVAAVDAGRVMPPDDEPPLSAEQIGVLRAWIDQGANWPAGADVEDPKIERAREHWAFQRLSAVDPIVGEAGDVWARTEIDAFIAEKLKAADLQVAEPAGAAVLARRIYFDMIGLPPTPEQVDQFSQAHATDSVAAIQELCSRLLRSPQYGERWGRHWLDLVRYAESDGQESDKDRPNAFRYRDFVIKAFNDDMGFDQFVRWQIAGDEYEPENPEAIVATGFLTAGTCSELAENFIEDERLFNRYNQLDDVISTLGSSMLGLTVGCARCHDHKYDAFSARDYYRLLSVFHSGDRKQGKLPSGEEGLFFSDYDQDIRTTWLFRRSDFYDRELEVQLGFPAILSSGREAASYRQAAVAAMPNANSTLQRRALADWITDVDQGGGALLARVIVNRVWQHYFGHGLVRTESDFGVRGEPPTHPQLLEYLTRDFVSNGWKIKRLHTMIVNSAVYHSRSHDTSVQEHNQQIDPENHLLWHVPARRLEAEALRDAMLAVNGTLNLQAGGPGFKPYISPDANLARNIKGDVYPEDAKDDASTRRRSVYMFHKRLVPYPLFQAFDRPDLLVGCSRRQNTTVAPQAMALLNDQFVRACAENFAKRLLEEMSHQTGDALGEDRPALVRRSFQLAFARLPSDHELAASLEFIHSQYEARKSRQESEAPAEALTLALTDYCQSLMSLNEFIYVD